LSDNDIFARLAAIVRRTFRLADEAAISPEMSSLDIDGWDSLSHSILIMEVEEEFEVSLALDRVYELSDIGELASLIRSTLEAKSQNSQSSQI
jgi:acyl carrier protein